MKNLPLHIYLIGSIVTTGHLIFTDLPDFNLWNWIIIIPANFFLGTIWPIYWAILYPLTGG